MTAATPPNMALTRLSPDFVLVVHSERAPTDREWESYLLQMESWIHAAGGELPAQLVVTRGGAPSAAQRRRAVLEARRAIARRRRIAVLTDSALVRAATRAVNFFHFAEARAFTPGDFEGALAFLGKDTSPELVRQECARLTAALAPRT